MMSYFITIVVSAVLFMPLGAVIFIILLGRDKQP